MTNAVHVHASTTNPAKSKAGDVQNLHIYTVKNRQSESGGLKVTHQTALIRRL